MHPNTALQSLALLAIVALVHPVQAHETGPAADRTLEQRLGGELSPSRRPEGEPNRYLRWVRDGETNRQPAAGLEMATEGEGGTRDGQRPPRTDPDRLGRG